MNKRKTFQILALYNCCYLSKKIKTPCDNFYSNPIWVLKSKVSSNYMNVFYTYLTIGLVSGNDCYHIR